MLQNKKVVMILALLVSIGGWIYVVTEIQTDTTKTFTDIPVEIEGEASLNSSGLALSDRQEYNVNLTFRGDRKELSTVKPEDINVTASVAACQEGENEVTCTVITNKNMSLASNRAAKLTVHVERQASESRLVTINYENITLEDGFEIQEKDMNLDTIKVTGAYSLVREIKEVSAVVSAPSLDPSFKTVTAHLIPVDSRGVEVQHIKMSSTITSFEAAMFYTAVKPVEVRTEGKPAKGYEVESIKFPEEVKVLGEQEEIENIDVLFTDEIDISGIKKDSEYAFKVDLPGDTKLAAGYQNEKITVKVKKSKKKKDSEDEEKSNDSDDSEDEEKSNDSEDSKE